MNCAATQHLHAGFFLKKKKKSFLTCSYPSCSHTHTHLKCFSKGQHMQMAQLTLSSLPGNPPLVLPLSIWSLCSSLQPGSPYPQPHCILAKSGPGPISHEDSARCGDPSLPTLEARPAVCFSGPLLSLDEQSPYWSQVLYCGRNPILTTPSHQKTERKLLCPNILIMNLGLGCCSSPSIKRFNRWGSRDRHWGSVRGRGKGKCWRLFFFSIDLNPNSHWLLLNKEPWEEVG